MITEEQAEFILRQLEKEKPCFSNNNMPENVAFATFDNGVNFMYNTLEKILNRCIKMPPEEGYFFIRRAKREYDKEYTVTLKLHSDQCEYPKSSVLTVSGNNFALGMSPQELTMLRDNCNKMLRYLEDDI